MKVFRPNFAKRGGLVTVVTQDASSKEVLMVAYANEEAWRMTLQTGLATYWSTRRDEIWVKGMTSGNVQKVEDVLIDCDGDALIYLVRQKGTGACHTDASSCFYRSCVGARQLMPAPKAGAGENLVLEECEISLSPAVPMQETDELLQFLLPSGSMSARVRSALVQSGYEVHEPDRTGFCGSSGGVDFFQRDRRMIPLLIGSAFQAGVTGKDLFLASGVQGLRAVAELPCSRASSGPTRWVLAASSDIRVLQQVRVGCELPLLAEHLLAGVADLPPYDVVRIEGYEESSIADGLCDAVLVVTETGSSLVANGLSIVEGCNNLLESYPQVLAMTDLSPAMEKRLREVTAALLAAVHSSDRVMVVCNLPKDSLEQVQLPAALAPTVSPLSQDGWVALQVCIERNRIGEVLASLQSAGAKAIAIQQLIGYLP
ncbi:phosphoribosyl-AMP cyclohydrolase [Candidatus Peregrinibacteria bacterium CG10_big_fil_rev_8_21_14_0_10_49_10]|nr:MAG: phosphoribosyl-AMP cyclohydrolase [Candidatus Peregrinibacteria bacterium CG10_big_fil_rev_8_21_14_0_10_49_10]